MKYRIGISIILVIVFAFIVALKSGDDESVTEQQAPAQAGSNFNM